MNNSFLKYLFTVVVSAWVLSLDQATKIFVHTQLKMGEPVVLIENFFNISYVRNAGGAFGLFSNSPDIVRFILFLLFPLFCAVIIFLMLRETKNHFQVTALAFILGGAVGNYIDRVRLGYVVDFIDITFNPYVFNLADCFVTLGIIFLLFDSFFVHKSDAE